MTRRPAPVVRSPRARPPPPRRRGLGRRAARLPRLGDRSQNRRGREPRRRHPRGARRARQPARDTRSRARCRLGDVARAALGGCARRGARVAMVARLHDRGGHHAGAWHRRQRRDVHAARHRAAAPTRTAGAARARRTPRTRARRRARHRRRHGSLPSLLIPSLSTLASRRSARTAHSPRAAPRSTSAHARKALPTTGAWTPSWCPATTSQPSVCRRCAADC